MPEPLENAIRVWWGPLLGLLALAMSWGVFQAQIVALQAQLVEVKAEMHTSRRDDREVLAAIATLRAEVHALRDELRRPPAAR